MKRFLLSILCCLLAVVSGYAEDKNYSYTFTSKQFTANGTKTLNNVDWTLSGDGGGYWGYDGTKGHQFGSGNAPYKSLILSTDGIPGTIKEIVINTSGASSTNAKLVVTVGGNVYGSQRTLTTTATNYTFDGTTSGEYFSGEIKLVYTQTSKKAIYIKSITITYVSDSSEPTVLPSPEFTPAECEFIDSQEVTITAEDGAKIFYTLDGSTPTVDSNEYTGVITLTETTTVKAIAVKDGYKDSEVVEATYTAIDPDATNYEIVTSKQGYENGEAVTSLKFGDVTATFASNGGTSPAYYNTGSAIRAYGKNTITFTGAGGVTITEIEFTFASGEGTNKITASSGIFSTNIWTGASNEVVFTIGGTSGHRRIAKIEVTYSVDENVVVIATPSITSSTSFVGSTTVEITNNEEGTTLYYSTNGEDYAQYTGALSFTETTTVYAYSQDAEGNKSSVVEATFTKIEVLTIAEAKAAYDNAGSDVDVAVDLTGAVVTVNSGQYLFIENETTGINLYNSGADYAVGTKFTAGYILGKSTQYGKMHQITGAEFNKVETTTVAVEPAEVEIADIKDNNAEYEGRFVKLSGVSIDVDGKTITQGEDTYALYNRFTLELTDVVKCDVEGIVAIYNTTEQLYITKVTPAKHTLHVTGAGYATLFLDFATVIPTGVTAYAVTEVNNGYVSLTPFEGILPANTGAIIEAPEKDYDFVAAAENGSAISGNKLLGTTVNTNISEEAYVLGMVDGVVGLYKAQMAGDVFLNNANKAYLPASLVPTTQGTKALKFRFDDQTTGINGVATGKKPEVIFDLYGRKVNNATAPGLYIINGKKVMVK